MYNKKKFVLLFAILLPCLIYGGSGGSKLNNHQIQTHTKTPTIFFQNDKWYVHIPVSDKIHSFSKEQIATIIANMPPDMRASVLCDAKNLDRVLDFIDTNKITPEIVPISNSNNQSKASIHPTWQAIMEQAKSYHSSSDREKYMYTTLDLSTNRLWNLYCHGNKDGLEKMRSQTITERKKFNSSDKAQQLDMLLEQIDQALKCPRFNQLHTIRCADLDLAIYTHNRLLMMPQQLIDAAGKILKSRPDYKQRLVHNALNSYQNTYQPKFLEIQPMIVEALNPNHSRDMVTQKLSASVNQVFANAYTYDYVVNYEVDSEIQDALNILSATQDVKAFTFEIAKIQHLLCDIQEQVIVYADLKPNIIEQAPNLLTRAIKEYWKDLAPTENEISFISDLACYISDVTIGTNYLSSEIIEQRAQGFWNNIEKLSFENLSTLTTENIIDAGAYVAARATWALGITRTAAVIRNIKNIGTAVNGAAISFADKFLKIFNNVIGQAPAVITSEGTIVVNASPTLIAETSQLISAFNDMKDIEKDKPEIIKDVDSVLDKQSEIDKGNKEFFQKFKEPLNKLTKNDGNIKKIQDMSIKESHIFSPKHKARGIMDLGKTSEEITHKIIEIVKEANLDKKLTRIDNPIFSHIDNIPVEIRVRIEEGVLININAFVGYSPKYADIAIRI